MNDVILPSWPAPKSVHALTTTRFGPGFSELPFYKFNLGSRCGDVATTVVSNRQSLKEAYHLPSEPLWLHQVHGIDVVRDDGKRHEEPMADASVSACLNSVLAVLTADCLPVLFCNIEGTEIAAAHAGWRGLAAGMLEATVQAMSSKPESIMAWMGPAAGAERYEVGKDVRQAFVAFDAQAAQAFEPTRAGHYLIDLYAIAKQRMQACGVTEIYGGDYCTISNTEFYSHRREQRTGRMASLIWLA